MFRRLTACFTAILLLCTGCTEVQPLSRTAALLDTVVTISLYDTQDTALLDECMEWISKREALWSRTAENSDIARINAAGGETVTVAEETAALLLTAQTYAWLTDGAFDMTIAPLTDLWDLAAQSGALPDEKALNKATALVGAENVQISGCDVTLPDAQAAIDLGGIAKGQIADELSALLSEHGCESAIIDLGGNIFLHGSRPNGTDFHVGIADPRADGEVIAAVAVSNGSVVTSGSYERRYYVGEQSFSHILDPHTGEPVENDLLSVTILSPTSVDGDALSTACFVMGLEKARDFIGQFDDIDAVFVTAEGEVIATEGVTLV